MSPCTFKSPRCRLCENVIQKHIQMILDHLFPELAGLGNVNKLSVSEFDNPCLNIYVIFSLCFSICVDVFEISIGVSHN